jgi:hypothetical protein
MVGYFKDRKRRQDIGQYKQEILANIEKIFQEVQYYEDIIKYKKKNENRKGIMNILLILEILFGYIHLRE